MEVHKGDFVKYYYRNGTGHCYIESSGKHMVHFKPEFARPVICGHERVTFAPSEKEDPRGNK